MTTELMANKNEWCSMRLGRVANIQTGPFGSQLHKKDYVERGTPIVTVEHLGNKRFTRQNLPHVKDSDRKRLRKYQLDCGDIVFSRVGSVDRCSCVNQSQAGWLFSGRCLRVRPKPELIDSEFLYYYFNLSEVKQFIRSIAVGATMPSLNTSLLGEVIIKFPSISQQRAIAATLSCLDDKIDLNNKINANLEAQAQAIFKSWFVDFEPFRDGEFVDSELEPIPKGWRVEKVGALCESISKTHSFDKSKLIFLNTGDITKGEFMHAHYSEVSAMPGQAKKSIKKNDILYSEIRPINCHFAYVDFNADDYVVSTKLMVIRTYGIEALRLYHYLTKQNTIIDLQHEAEFRSGTFPQIRFENISNLKMLIADDKTEKRFYNFLNAVYGAIKINNAQKYKLSCIRNALLPQLMSGEIKVPYA